MSDKDNEKLTEQQKKNRQNWKPEPWAGICPVCKKFHKPRDCKDYAGGITISGREKFEPKK